MPSYKTAFGSWLKTEDLQGHAVSVVVESASIESVKDQESGAMEKKLVLSFSGKDKRMILNLTNCESLEHITGTPDYEQWNGVPIVLFPTTTKFGNKTVPCMRIRAVGTATPVVVSPPPVAVTPELTSDDIPFTWLLALVIPALGMLA